MTTCTDEPSRRPEGTSPWLDAALLNPLYDLTQGTSRLCARRHDEGRPDAVRAALNTCQPTSASSKETGLAMQASRHVALGSSPPQAHRTRTGVSRRPLSAFVTKPPIALAWAVHGLPPSRTASRSLSAARAEPSSSAVRAIRLLAGAARCSCPESLPDGEGAPSSRPRVQRHRRAIATQDMRRLRTCDAGAAQDGARRS